MSYMIMKSITIMPDKIVYTGHSNNVYPHTDSDWEVPFDWQHLRWLVNDLVGYCIQPQQRWWKNVVTDIGKRYDYSDVCQHDDIAEDAMEYLLALYNVKVTENYQRLIKNDPSIKLQLLTLPKKEEQQ